MEHNILKPSQHNLNNWAWTEKDFSDYANKKFKELLNFEEQVDKYKITSETKIIKGEAFKYVRKNKLHLSYDYKLLLDVKIKYEEKQMNVSVTIEPFVDDEPEDWDMEIKLKDGDSEDFKQIKNILSIKFWMKYIQQFIDDFQKQE